MAIAPNGNPGISYRHPDGAKFAACNNPTCTSATLTVFDDSAGANGGTSLVYGNQGYPIVAYYDLDDTGLKVATCTSACTHPQVIYWIDILSHELYIYDPATGSNRTIPTCQAVGTVVKRAAGGLVLALHNGFAFLDLDTEKMTPVADPERDIPANRFNDGKCDPAGRFWAGTMEFGGAPDAGALYCLDTDHTVTEKLRPVTISNGIVWTADDRTMYYICTAANTVRAFDYDIDTGAISNERVVVTNEGEGGFDGMAIDAEDKLWVAVFGGWGVRRYDPETGALLSEVRLPIAQVTACAFGGDNLETLYITTATHALNDEQLAQQPLAGGLFVVDAGVRGQITPKFAG